jgi:hypothetical protein
MKKSETHGISFEDEFDEIVKSPILEPSYIKKRLIVWTIRQTISVVLYALFWKYSWVKWTLLLTIPLSLFSLFAIVGFPYLLRRKIERAKAEAREAEKIINQHNN